MGILSWIESRLPRQPDLWRKQERQRLGADLRKLRADAEALSAKGRALRQRIGAALAEEHAR